MVGNVAMLAGLRWPAGLGAGSRADPGEPVADVEGIGDLALLAVADAVDADVDLLGDRLPHRRREARLECRPVERLAALARLQEGEQIGRAGQAADMRRQDPILAELHGADPPAMS